MASKCFKNYPTSPVSKQQPNPFHEQVSLISQPYKEQILLATNKLKNQLTRSPTNKDDQHKRLQSYMLTPPVQRAQMISQYPNDNLSLSPISHDQFQVYLKQWRPNHSHALHNYQSICANQQDIFSDLHRLKVNKQSNHDYKHEQKQMLQRIFDQIKTDQQFASFSAITSFFSRCNLFYLYYNIRPTTLHQTMTINSTHKHNYLTCDQFISMLQSDRPNQLVQYSSQTNDSNQKCILSDDDWQQLKNIFDTLDTFGGNAVASKAYLRKLMGNCSYKWLVNSPAIEFLDIKRVYNLKKVLFELETKAKVPTILSWNQFRTLVENFIHIQQPSIDKLYENLLQHGIITSQSNSFLLKNEVINSLQHIFSQYPKYYRSFVKKSTIVFDMLSSKSLRSYLFDTVRIVNHENNNQSKITLQDQIRLLAASDQQYIDSDQFLQHFSIRGLINSVQKPVDSDTSESQDNQPIIRKVKSQKIFQQRENKMLVKLPTVVCEFNFTRKYTESIRNRKLKEMLAQKQRQQSELLNKKFKASPIPSGLNGEHYNAYITRLKAIKTDKEMQLKRRRQCDARIIHYLQQHTRLLEQKKQPQAQPVQYPTFTAKPVPWTNEVSLNMLQKINEEKLARRKLLLSNTKTRVKNEWKKLPAIIKEENMESSNLMTSQIFDTEYDSHKQFNKQFIKAKQVPNFDQLHKKFQEQLQAKKQSFKPTIVKQFHLSTPKPSRTPELPPKHFKSQHKVQTRQSVRHSAPIFSLTKKYQHLIAFNRSRLAQKEQKILLQKQQQLHRKLRQANFAKYMRKKFSKSLQSYSSIHVFSQVNSKKMRKKQLSLKRKHQRQLGQIYTRVLSRPFLFQLESVKAQDSRMKGRQFDKQSKYKTKHDQNYRRVNYRHNCDNTEQGLSKHTRKQNHKNNYFHDREQHNLRAPNNSKDQQQLPQQHSDYQQGNIANSF